MKTLILSLVLFVSCGHMSQKSSEEMKFDSLLSKHWGQTMKKYPEFGTWTNYKDGIYNGKWSDPSLLGSESSKKFIKKKLNELSEINRSKLGENSQLNYDLYMGDLKNSIAGFSFPNELLVLDQLSGFHLSIPGLLSRMPTRSKKDYENILERFEKVPFIIKNKILILKEGLKRKVTPARITLRDIAQQFDSVLESDINKNPMTKAFTKFPKSFSEKEKEQYREIAQNYLLQTVKEFRIAKEFIVKDYIPYCRNEIGMSAVADGVQWYEHLIKGHTTTKLSAENIHELGLFEVKRIKEKMNKVIKDLGYKGNFKSFLHYLRTDKKFFFTKKEQLLSRYRNIAKQADFKLYEVFKTLPRTPYGVEPTPAYMQESAPTAYYYGGSHSAGRPGVFYANTYNLKSRPIWEMVPLTLHEAVPGHHLQISLNEELGEVPNFRKYLRYTAFIEGWGLYAESLGEEMGMYNDPYDKFGQLSYEMWRAIRLVVDTGMHIKGWSREKAITYFMNHAPKPKHDITVEIDRYITWPGQALSYKIGELKFKELRRKASVKLGEKFDLREYHNEILKNGALPLNIVERNIDKWIETKK